MVNFNLIFFPKVFGINADKPLDRTIVKQKFQVLAQRIQDGKTPEQIASGYLAIAVDMMANAIKKISLQKGYDVTEYTLCCFGGAGGQHACLIADVLGIKRIFIHPYAGVLSAYGIGLADIRILKEKSLEAELKSELLGNLRQVFQELISVAQEELSRQQVTIKNMTIVQKVHLKYSGTDSSLIVDFASLEQMRSQFEQEYQQRYGFRFTDKNLVVETISVELICPTYTPKSRITERQNDRAPQAITTVKIYTTDAWYETPIYQRETLQPGDIVDSPAIIIEPTGTNIVEPGWQGKISDQLDLVLEKKN